MKDFETWVKELTPMIYSIIHRLKIYKNQEEYFQIGLIGLWKAYQTYNPEKSTFPTYAYHYIRGYILTELRANYRREDGELNLTDYEWRIIPDLDEFADPEYQFQIVEDLNDLSPHLRQVIIMHYLYGYPLKEIARQFNISYSTIKRWKSEAISLLKEKFHQ